jgi:ABC-type arginine/histidine transport system permease subunit
MEGLVIKDVAQIIATIGFPAFVAIWLLYYGKKQQEELTKALIELKLEVQLTRRFIDYLVNKDKKEDK